jgi:hypothetical protein
MMSDVGKEQTFLTIGSPSGLVGDLLVAMTSV